jgi:hypothetical protein
MTLRKLFKMLLGKEAAKTSDSLTNQLVIYFEIDKQSAEKIIRIAEEENIIYAEMRGKTERDAVLYYCYNHIDVS